MSYDFCNYYSEKEKKCKHPGLSCPFSLFKRKEDCDGWYINERDVYEDDYENYENKEDKDE